jgi:ABC-type bacteriocin/lantibiotic exporter with double-glycine peptidase domain
MPNAWLSVPHYKQEFNYSCLAACARMVLAFHGYVVAEADLRLLLATRASGTTARHVRALAAFGFDVELTSTNLAALQSVIADGLPPIVFLDTGVLEYWHTDCARVAVVVGVDDDNVYLNDPFFETSPQQTSRASFLHAWAANTHLAAILRPRTTSDAEPKT